MTALVVNLGQSFLARRGSFVTRAGAPLGLFLATLPVLLGVVLHFRATATLVPDWSYQLGGSYVVAMLVTALSCRVGAFLYRHEHPSVSWVYFFGTAAATMTGAAGLLNHLAARAVAGFGAIRSVPQLWVWLKVMATDPWARDVLLDTVWRLAPPATNAADDASVPVRASRQN